MVYRWSFEAIRDSEYPAEGRESHWTPSRTFPVTFASDWRSFGIISSYWRSGVGETHWKMDELRSAQISLHDSGDVLKGLSKKMAEVDQFVHYT